jgi:hypothetical protein
MKVFALALAGTALIGAPALAQTAPATPTQQANAPTTGAASAVTLTPGMAVTDAQGGAVGTIESVTPQGAIVSTGTAKATLPTNAFAKRENGVAIGMTKAELEAAVNTAKTPEIAVGAAISGPAGASVGTVEAVNGDQITVATASGAKAVLPKQGFAQGPNGLVIGMTAAQLEAAVKAATPAAPGASN